MSAHEQFAEDLALYAVGALPSAEVKALEKHLEECAGCRRELESLRGDAALLALSATGPAAPTRSRERFVQAIAVERHPRFLRRRRSLFELLPVCAAVVMLLITILLWRENVKLRRRLDYTQNHLAQNQEQLLEAQHLQEIMHDRSAQQITLVAEHEPARPYGKAVYSWKHGRLVFMASNLGQLPAGKTYQLWIVPMKGDKPMPAGVFKPDPHGNAMLLEPCCPGGLEAKAFAVTIENDGGSATPTTPILMSGSGG
ncbi:MAG TPA: anti-sigma factor [Terriglobales bacterium]|nr:anti-sigma factor [Terriglobales bacterium]